MTSLDQFRETYFTECGELLTEMEGRLVALNPDTADKDTLNAIFRCAHSIKGGAGAFGLDYITNFTHVLEALLDAMREGKILPTREAVDTLLKSVDIVTQMVQAAKTNTVPPADFGADILVSLQRLAGHAPESEATIPPPPRRRRATARRSATGRLILPRTKHCLPRAMNHY